MISDLFDGSSANGIYLIKNVTKGVNQSGANYLNITLQDKTGTIEGKKWDINDGDLDIFKIGEIVHLEGDTYEYKNKLQVKIYDATSVEPNVADANMSALLIESPIPLEDLLKRFNYFKDSVKNADCKKILDGVFKKYYQPFIDFPAAVSNHHDFYHGLLYHTVSMCNVAESISKLYPDVDYDMLISGCLLHDVGKVVEFSGPVATHYTIEGNLLGHISIGMSIVKEVADEEKVTGEVPLLLEHMILSHHGKYEFGSPELPDTREALLLSMIDDMDSKMMVLDKAYKDVKEGEYTDRIYAFDGRTFYKPKKL